MPGTTSVVALLLPVALLAQTASPERYDVVWDSPSRDHHGSMPLGNGDIALNAWVEPDGALVFYIAKTDAWSENGRLLKVGRVRVTVDPPLDVATGYEQRLGLSEGGMVVRCGAGEDAATLRLVVDRNHPVIDVALDSARARRVTATIERWRTERTPYEKSETSDLLEDRSQRAPGGGSGLREPVFVEPDTLLTDLEGEIGWYHWNRESHGPALLAETQGLADWFEGKVDPLRHRIFGALIRADGGERLDDARLRTATGRQQRLRVFVRTEHPSTPEQWLTNLRAAADAIEQVPLRERRVAHVRGWEQFWQRSWIHVTQVAGTDPVPRNDHPVRIGVDQHGHNRFVGELGRLSIAPGVASNDVIEALAQDRGADSAAALRDALFTAATATPGPIDGSAGWTFADGLLIEAWLRPGDLPPGGGRLVDKTTPGSADGLLFDTWPGHSLRLIVGARVLRADDVLPRDEWVHVAATVDAKTGRLALFVAGREVAADENDGLDDAAVVSRAYALQRWIDACAGDGRYPIKFNGSLFTVPHEGAFGDADYRRWGPGYWWQNTRLPYLSMCASGDFELMRPLFRLYAEELVPLCVHRTQRYTGHGGAFVPECMHFFGTIFAESYGWTPFAERGDDKLQESRWHKWEWVSGLELVWMMLEWCEHTGDEAYLREVVVPTAREILTFFVEHYATDEKGRLVMHPSQALETWWDCTNPMPEVAGLRAVSARLLALPATVGGADDRALWARVRDAAPDLPVVEQDGALRLAPAERFADKRNVENPELYAVFPFRLVSFEKENAALGRRALAARLDRGASGWRQDDLFMTFLGLADEAAAQLVQRARSHHAGSRFPAFWGPNYDWIPDQDHGGVLMRALQTMLLQTEGRAIHLLPAWPRAWDADFKLHAPYETVVSGRVRGGRLEDLVVTPESRRADVVVHGR